MLIISVMEEKKGDGGWEVSESLWVVTILDSWGNTFRVEY